MSTSCAVQLRRIREAQTAAALQARTGQAAIATAEHRASLASEQQAAVVVEAEARWAALQQDEADQRQRLAQVLDDFKKNTEPIRSHGPGRR